MDKYVLNPDVPHQKFFEDMTRIPHGSYHEQAYSDYLVNFAKSRGLQYKQDSLGNVIIYKPGSCGYEGHPAVMLQSHMDMVWEKNQDCTHNFETEPLDLYIEDGYLWARGTTLGADDGVGVAYTLAILDDDTLPHPPLECVFTVQEEVGLYGAFAIDPADITAKRMIGLDDGGGGKTTYTTSAGGSDGTLTKSFTLSEEKGIAYRLKVGGLKGGHSGDCIDEELGNALKCCTRILMVLQDSAPLHLVSLEGGWQDNAIPRECEAVFLTDCKPQQVQSIVCEMTAQLKKELEQSDPNLFVSVEECASIKDLPQDSLPQKALNAGDSASLLDLLYIFPHGMRHKSLEIEGLPIASENMAAVHFHDGQFSLIYSPRAMYDSHLDQMEREIEIIARLYGCTLKKNPRYPSWEYRKDSFMREKLQEVVLRRTGEELILLPVHGGLECGVFSRLNPEMDIVTLGAVGLDVHTPQEHLDLKSFDDVYLMLTDLLKEL